MNLNKINLKKLLRYLGYTLTVLFILVVTIFFIMIYTTWGCRQIISIAGHYSGGELKVANISGAIADNLTINDLSFKNESTKVDLGEVILNWEWSRIFSGEISISRFELGKAQIRLEEQPAPQESKPLDLSELMNIDLGLLLSLKLRQFSISESYLKYGEQKFTIDAIQLGSSLEDSVVQINIENANAQIKEKPLYLKTNLKFDTSGDIPALSGSFAWATTIDLDEFSGNGTIEGDFSKLIVNHQLIHPWKVESNAVLGIDAEYKPYYSVTTNFENVGYPVANSVVTILESTINIVGNNQGLNFDISSNTDYQGTIFNINTNGNFDGKRLDLAALKILSESKFLTVISGQVDIADKIGWKLKTDSQIYNVDRFVPELQQQQLNPIALIEGVFDTNTQKVESSIDLNIDNIFANNLSAITQMVFADNTLQAKTEVVSPYKLNSNLDFNVADNSFNLNLSWQQLFWPLVKLHDLAYDDNGMVSKKHVVVGDILLSDKGKVQLVGTADKYQLSTSFNAKVENINADFSTQGKGSMDSFEITNSDIKSSVGSLQTNGIVSWGDNLVWDANIVATNIDLETFGLQKSDVSLGVKTSGKHIGNKTDLLAKISDIKGTIGKEKVRGHGVVTFNRDISHEKPKADIKADLDVNIAETSAKIGVMAFQTEENININGDYRINIDSISSMLPGSTGSGLLFGKISGDSDGYNIIGKGFLSNFKHSDLRCKNGDFVFRVSTSSLEDIVSTLSSEFRGNFVDITNGDLKFAEASISAEGSADSHKLQFDLDGDYKAKLQLDGSFDTKSNNWKAKLNQTWVENEVIGRWDGSEILIEFVNDAISIPMSCFNGSHKSEDTFLVTPEKICIGGVFSESLIKAKVDIHKIDLLRFKALVPQDVGVQGLINGDIAAEIKSMDFVNANIDSNLQSEQGVLTLTLLDKKKVDLPFELVFDTKLKERIGNSKASIKVNGDLDGSALAKFELPNNDAELDKTKLTSSLHFRLNNFEWVDEIWPEFESVNAKLIVNAAADGRLNDLRYNGSAKITEGALSILSTGVVLKDITGTVDFDTDQIILNGYANSGEGKISVSGNANKQDVYPINIDIIGNSFRVIDTYEAKVDISPLLSVQLLENKTKLNGAINIDTARIRVGDLPETAVSVSDDVNIIKPDQQETAQTNEVEANLKLNLGEACSFKGFGLTTKLIGSLNIKQKKGLREGFGELELKEGKFKKLGINLDIEQGQLIFVGPLDNPALNIKAARKLERAQKDEKVSVMIKGTIKKPRLVFPEESTYGQTNAMSNLVTGGESGSEGDKKSQALYSIGLSAGGRFKDQVQDELGLDSLEITAAGWMLGKYLTPDLYVSYTTRWLKNETQLKLRYNLNRLFTLEAKSGDQQGADIFYTLEGE